MKIWFQNHGRVCSKFNSSKTLEAGGLWLRAAARLAGLGGLPTTRASQNKSAGPAIASPALTQETPPPAGVLGRPASRGCAARLGFGGQQGAERQPAAYRRACLVTPGRVVAAALKQRAARNDPSSPLLIRRLAILRGARRVGAGGRISGRINPLRRRPVPLPIRSAGRVSRPRCR